MTREAIKGTFVVYNIDTEEPLMTVKNAQNPDDPAWLQINGDTKGENHARLDIHPDIYNQFDHQRFQDHIRQKIPQDKAQKFPDRVKKVDKVDAVGE